MTPSSSPEELCARAQLRNLSLDDLKPEQGLPLMFDFYKEVRADGCIAPLDRDILAFLWGTYDRGEGMYFQLKIARQFAMEAVGAPRRRHSEHASSHFLLPADSRPHGSKTRKPCVLVHRGIG